MIPKPESVWHRFRGKALEVMRTPDRAHHPSRAFVDALMFRWYGQRPFAWLDVGVVGMVDYERLRPVMQFIFTGADLSEPVAQDSRSYLTGPGDRIVVWDIEEAPPSDLGAPFDLVTLRHVLNHCTYYESPLKHAADVLRPGGRVVVVLHLSLIEGVDRLSRHRDWDIEGEVIGNRYARDRFLQTFGRHFVPDLFVRIDNGHKPNDVIVGHRRAKPVPDGVHLPLPPMRRLWAAPGRRHLPRRLLSRARLAFHRGSR